MRTSADQFNGQGILLNGFDYNKQAWVKDGKYVRCGHPETMKCRCYGREHAGEPVAVSAEPIHVLFVLDDNGEANGTVRVYCSIYCREKALQTNEDPVAKGEEPVTEFVGWQCEFCGEELRYELR